MTFLSVSLHMPGFKCPRSTLCVTSHLDVSAENISNLSTGAMTAGCTVLNKGIMVLLLDRRHRLEVMRQLNVEHSLG